MRAFANRLIKGSLLTPSVVKSSSYNTTFQIEPFTKRGEAICNSIYCQNPVAACISSLMNWKCPNAVKHFIIAISIYALNAPAFLAVSHILKKVFKRLKPSLADGNPSTSVILETVVLWRRAAPNQSKPAVINSSAATSVCSLDCWENVNKETAARSGVPTSQVSVCGNDLFPALATAKTHIRRISSSRCLNSSVSKYEKPSKLFPDDVYSLRHCIGFLFALFSGACPATTGTPHDYEFSYAGVK